MPYSIHESSPKDDLTLGTSTEATPAINYEGQKANPTDCILGKKVHCVIT